MRKLRQMKDDDEIRKLVQSKFDRQTLAAVLQITRMRLKRSWQGVITPGVL
jgi:hypothetical protein